MCPPADEHVIEMAEVPHPPKASMSARLGSQDVPLFNAPVRMSLLGLTSHGPRAGRAHADYCPALLTIALTRSLAWISVALHALCQLLQHIRVAWGQELCMSVREKETRWRFVSHCPESPYGFLQASDAPTEAVVSSPLPKSPFQKPSVQVISLSDDGSEAPTTVRHPFCTWNPSTPPCFQAAVSLHVSRCAVIYVSSLTGIRQDVEQMLKCMCCSQGDIMSQQLPGTWHSDELPDAEALVSLTFRLLFPDTFQHILPVHKHKVCRSSRLSSVSLLPPQKTIIHLQDPVGWKSHGTLYFPHSSMADGHCCGE